MAMRGVGVFVVLSLVSAAYANIYHPSDLMDEIISLIVPSLTDSFQIEDFSYSSPCGNSVQCWGGAATGLTSIARKGYARIQRRSYYSNIWDIWATLSLQKFDFRFPECAFDLNGNQTTSDLSGRALDSSFNIKLAVTEGLNCTTEFANFSLQSVQVLFNQTRGLDILKETRILDNVTQVVKKDIIDSVNFNLYEITGNKFSSLKNCK